MKNFPLFLCCLAIPAMMASAPRAAAAPPGYNLAKEKGAVYLKDILEEDQKVSFRVLRPTPVYSNKDAQGVLGTLDGGQNADLEAFTPFALRVRGKGTNGHIVGWVNPRDLEAPAPGLLDTLRQIAERREAVAKLIAAKQVALGMTPGEVAESRGEPTKQQSQVTPQGRTDIWEYIEYEVIPRYEIVRDPATGASYRRFTHNEKIEKGKSTIEFKDGVVNGIAEMQDNSRRKELLTVPVPIVFTCP